jgi:hypothetical protein
MLATRVERATNRQPKLRSKWLGGAVEIVLGVSMTPTTVRMALVEGEKADGVILEHDVFDITSVDGAATSSVADQVIAAILGTQEGAIVNGHNLLSTGVAWSDRGEAAALREALEARGIEDVLLVSELHAAAALAQAVGRAMGYDRTALVFIERDTATLAVVETADGSVLKVLSQRLHDADPIVVLTKMTSSLEAQDSPPHGIFLVGSGVDVASVKSRLQDLVSVPVVASLEPQLALPRGAALASANAPRFDTTTIGLAYSQDPGETVIHPMALAAEATEFLGRNDVSTDADIGSSSDDMPAGRKPFALAGSTVAAIFTVGVTVLTITMAVNLEPAAERATDAVTVPPSAVAPPPAIRSAQPGAPPPAPEAVPVPAIPPLAAAAATARLKVPPAPPPPRVVVRNAAPAPAAPAPRPAPPPPIAPPPAPVIPWLPPILQPYVPPVLGPSWHPGPKKPKPPWGRGGGGDGD